MDDEYSNGIRASVRFVEKRSTENTERIMKLEEKHMETLLTLIDVKNVVSRVEDKLIPITKKLETYEDGTKQSRRAWLAFAGQVVTAICAIIAAYIAVKAS